MTGHESSPHAQLIRFYQWQSRWYDATRWSFLFGRKQLIRAVANQCSPSSILEVGCGTGANLVRLATQFPAAHITGIDLSAEMLAVAKRKIVNWSTRVNLLQQAYEAPIPGKFDLILFSYSLSMMNPGWQQAIQSARDNLSTQGVLAVVDFDVTSFSLFRRWMAINHVRMDGHLLPQLLQQFTPQTSLQCSAYLGMWRYFLYIGNKAECS